MSLDGLCCRELHECYPVICEQLDIPAEGGSVKETRRIRHWRDRLPPLVFPNFQHGGYDTSLNPFKHENAYGFYRYSIYIDDEWDMVDRPTSIAFTIYVTLSHIVYGKPCMDMDSKPDPYSNPLTALILIIALDNSA